MAFEVLLFSGIKNYDILSVMKTLQILQHFRLLIFALTIDEPVAN
jgi:hypothetical protein